MNILVTGGAGYIGSHACRALAAAGYTPVTYDNLSKGRRNAVLWGPLETGDLRDADRLAQVFDAYRPAAVMHFAGFIEVGESVTDPATCWDSNVIGSFRLAEAMVNAGCRNLVFSSTCAVYDGTTGALLNETSPISPINAYGRSKHATEMMLHDFGTAHDLRTVMFRYFNVAGAHRGAGIGQAHDGAATHIIPRLLMALAGGQSHMTIHGDDYDTPDGTCVRDYIHIDDLVRAHVSGLERLLGGGEGGTFNLGTGTGASVRDVIETASRVVGFPPQIQVGPRRAGDAARLISGSEKAAEALGWSPESSDLETIIGDAWAWHQTRGWER
ncbi:MAG: UDP-glucose 4-epimerase GalE [Pseudomonadota bacterium]